jgi:predicted HTH domain antitoxin
MQITIDLPDSLQITEADLRTELAITLFQQERVTLGTASQIAGMHQMEFHQLMGSRGICIHYDVAEFEEDLHNIRPKLHNIPESRGWHPSFFENVVSSWNGNPLGHPPQLPYEVREELTFGEGS